MGKLWITLSPKTGDKSHHCHHEKMAFKAIFSWWLVTLVTRVVTLVTKVIGMVSTFVSPNYCASKTSIAAYIASLEPAIIR